MKSILIFALCFFVTACSHKDKDTSRKALLPDGKVIAYWEGSDLPMYEKEWRAKTPHGKWKEYHRNGKLAQSYEYDHGKKTGTWLRYYEDGKLASEGHYSDDKEDGQWTTWYPDGKKSYEGAYKNGLKEGKHISYNRGGKIEQQMVWKDGKPAQ